MAKVKQLTISLENQPGALARVAQILADAKVNIVALLGSTSDDLGRYWFGGRDNPARGRVARYLFDLGSACSETAAVLAKRARAIFVVSRRSVAGRRLYIDKFIMDRMRQCGFRLEQTRTRKLRQKNTPRVINANGAGKGAVRTVTMREELILCFVRK